MKLCQDLNKLIFIYWLFICLWLALKVGIYLSFDINVYFMNVQLCDITRIRSRTLRFHSFYFYQHQKRLCYDHIQKLHTYNNKSAQWHHWFQQWPDKSTHTNIRPIYIYDQSLEWTIPVAMLFTFSLSL